MEHLLKSDNQSDETGALWIRTNDKKVQYFSIKLNIKGEEINLKAFRNGKKQEGDKKPDYIIYQSKNVPVKNN